MKRALAYLSNFFTMEDFTLERHKLPEGMRYSNLDERKNFYQREFNLTLIDSWLKDVSEKPIFAVVIGRHTKISPEKYREDSSTTIIIRNYQDLDEVKVWILEFLPESIYYDRNVYDEDCKVIGQELAFDLDSARAFDSMEVGETAKF